MSVDRRDAGKQGSAKKIVMCFDGTANQIRAERNTNVVKIFRALENEDGQLLYYDPGVGTFASTRAWSRPGRWASKMLGRAFGLGLKTNLAEAYSFLMDNWNPGDEVFIFGFSRGAFNARALVGLLNCVGIPRRSSQNLVQYAIALYAREWKTGSEAAEANEFRRTVCRAADRNLSGDNRFVVPVRYVGLFDTVTAPGIYRRAMTFQDIDTLGNVANGRHAISIDENRRAYRDRPVANTNIDEAWFAGVHSDVGGGFQECQLGDIALVWVLDGAVASGLKLREAGLRGTPDLTPGHRNGVVNSNSRWWALATYRQRTAPQHAKLHKSVVDRIDGPSYESRFTDPVVVDSGWLESENWGATPND